VNRIRAGIAIVAAISILGCATLHLITLKDVPGELLIKLRGVVRIAPGNGFSTGIGEDWIAS
jgi:hypothetical protein